jgi:5-methylcytosine-specific restriction endonuclease McrA
MVSMLKRPNIYLVAATGTSRTISPPSDHAPCYRYHVLGTSAKNRSTQRLRNIRINVSTKTPLGRKVLRLELAEFVLRCFRRNSTCAYFLKQLELRP